MRRLARSIAALALAAGCSAPAGGAAADLAILDLARAPDLAPLRDLTVLPDLAYPTGPYGAAVGDTLPDFRFPGYYAGTDTTALANTHPFVTVCFDQMRASGARYAMIMLADFW
jgi:hypothetical protein